MDDQDARPLTRRISDCEIEDFTELEDYRIWSRIPLDGGARFSGALKLRTFAPYPDVRGESEAEEIIEASLERHGTEPLSDDEMMRQLKFGEMNEAVTPGKASADTLDVSDDERARNAALKAVYDESIRAGNPGGYISIEACLDRLNRYLPATGGLKSPGQAWRNVLKDIPEPYLSHREESGQMQVRVESRSFMHVGDNENDGGAEHWATMKDAYVPMTQLGFVFDIPEQDGSDMPDAIARLDDALDLPNGENLNAKLDAIDEYQEQYPVLDRLAGVEDAYVESEHSTGSSQPSQTVENVNQAYAADRRCLLVCREQTAERVATTLLDEPKGCHKNHDIDGERRLYTLTRDVVIDGETMTRPGSRENIWVYDSDSGEYILRDNNRTEHARFSSVTAIRENASAYPDNGEWRVKAPVIPRYDPDMLDIIIVPEDAEAPNDLLVYRRDGAPIPLPDLTDRRTSEATQSQQHDSGDAKSNETTVMNDPESDDTDDRPQETEDESADSTGFNALR